MMREKVLATLLLTVVVPGWSQRVVKNQSDSIANTEKKLTTVNLDPVVVTGSGHHERLKSSVTPVRVISDTDIRRLGTANINEVLTRLVPQISTSPNSTGSYLHLNGLSNRYILILVNGRRLIG
ncbi:MAG: TonB-dependent receptor plug domain-containing protein, partial [Prevotella sp.]